jgi:hypothetical protein
MTDSASVRICQSVHAYKRNVDTIEAQLSGMFTVYRGENYAGSLRYLPLEVEDCNYIATLLIFLQHLANIHEDVRVNVIFC